MKILDPVQQRSEVLQQARHGGTVDQRGQIRIEVDTVVMSWSRGQSGASSVIRIGLQPRQFLEASGTAQIGEEMVTANDARKID